ncbi:unnamed protein product [Taenia asiatica]|uniref:Uncharacterized protein n=1 Tax=Taenia asiatica TaxID=60517 RepID=A0A0R3W3N9_TAEAS|nr:unnamed protein product [Taenia asiatica]
MDVELLRVTEAKAPGRVDGGGEFTTIVTSFYTVGVRSTGQANSSCNRTLVTPTGQLEFFALEVVEQEVSVDSNEDRGNRLTVRRPALSSVRDSITTARVKGIPKPDTFHARYMNAARRPSDFLVDSPGAPRRHLVLVVCVGRTTRLTAKPSAPRNPHRRYRLLNSS